MMKYLTKLIEKQESKIVNCLTIILIAILTFLPLGVVAQQESDEIETDEISYEVDNSLVQVAFRSIEKQQLLGGVSVINVSEMMTKSYAFSSLDYLDAVIGGVNGVNSWGMNGLLVVIDGIPRDYDNVLASEIEQVTVLKGAAAIALYGSRAAKGVIQITTKRGMQGDLRVNVRANSGINVPKIYPKYLGAAEYMTLYNEARTNDGMSPLYSQEQIYNHGSGINPYRYPDLNFYNSDYLKKVYNTTEAMAEITGGNERAQYYTTMGYARQGSILKVGNAKNDNTTRMFIRGNIDMKLHELITANVDANATFYDAASANATYDGDTKKDFWWGAENLRPNRINPLIPLSYIESNDELSLAMTQASSHIIDGKYFLGGTQLDPTNPIADTYAAGTGKWVSRQFQFNGGVNVNLRDVADGLFLRGKYGVDYATTYTQAYNNDYATYTPSWTNYAGDDMIGSLVQNGMDKKDGVQNISSPTYRTTTFFSGQLDYTTTLSGGHNIFAMLLANGWMRKLNGEYQAIQSANLGLQLSYNFNQKYYADLTLAVPYSPKLPESNRIAFSPVGTLGWRITNEDFMSNQTVFNDLMLTVTAGIINSDLDIRDSENEMGYFLYKAVVKTRDAGWWTWGDAHGQDAIAFSRGTNPNLGFIKRKDMNVGLRGSLLNKLITFDVNYFFSRMDGGLARTSSLYPSYFTQTYPESSFIPYVNYEVDDRQGVDFSVYFNQKFDEVLLSLGVNGMYRTTKAMRRDENFEFDYQSRVGHPLNQYWGLQSLGFFKDQADIESSPRQSWGAVQPGDIKYKNQNSDGVIDANDEVYLGSWSSTTVLGLNLTAKWKRFTFFAMGTGYFGGYGHKDNSYYWAGRSDRKYSEVVRDRWTENTNNTATYPRLTTTNGDNNFRYSDFWLYKTNAFYLSNVQLTYHVPSNYFTLGVVKDLSIYIGGYNLLTIAKERKYLEMNVGEAPSTRYFNFGVKATF